MTITDTTAVRSADGTRIAYFRDGTGTAIILIDPALSTHKGSAKLSAALAAALLVRSATTDGVAARAATSSRAQPIRRARSKTSRRSSTPPADGPSSSGRLRGPRSRSRRPPGWATA